MKTVSHNQLILWTLKLEGNITEPDGNAREVLMTRVKQLCSQYGYEFIESRFGSALNNAVYNKTIKRDGKTSYKLITAELGKNPFAGTSLAVPAKGAKPSLTKSDLTDDMRKWSISRRNQLIADLAQSNATDLAAYKGVVIEGI